MLILVITAESVSWSQEQSISYEICLDNSLNSFSLYVLFLHFQMMRSMGNFNGGGPDMDEGVRLIF